MENCSRRDNSIFKEKTVYKLTEELQHYHGREQSYIKHIFLKKYLEILAYKIFQRNFIAFNFVDGFAGPWKVSDEESNSDASFNQAVKTLRAVQLSLRKKGIDMPKLRFCFCEKNEDSVGKLRQYAQSHNDLNIHVFQGRFEDNLRKIDKICKNGFTFSFIDPTGWDIDTARILCFLENRKGEFLINYMSEPINRHAEYYGVSKSMGRFLADPSWEQEFNSLPSELNNEQRVLQLWKKKARQSKVASFLPDFEILRPRQNRLKMRLLLGTHSIKGLEVFRDVQAKAELEQFDTRERLRVNEDEQMSLFEDKATISWRQETEGIGSATFKEKARTRIVKKVSDKGRVKFLDLVADVLENVSIRKTQLKDLIVNMRRDGVVDFDSTSPRSKPKDGTLISLAKP